MPSRLILLFLLCAASSLPACKAKQDANPPNPISGSPRSQPIDGNPLSQVQRGMTKGQVRNLIGSPQGENSYTPWTFALPGLGEDAPMRTEWHYRNRGTVTFTESVQRGGTATVTRVDIVRPKTGAAP